MAGCIAWRRVALLEALAIVLLLLLYDAPWRLCSTSMAPPVPSPLSERLKDSALAGPAACSWTAADVRKNTRCSRELWQKNPIDRADAVSRCNDDDDCAGLMFAQDRGAASDGRVAARGWYQGCGGAVSKLFATDGWDTIVKPPDCPATGYRSKLVQMFHVHIPKTAGTSLQFDLQAHLNVSAERFQSDEFCWTAQRARHIPELGDMLFFFLRSPRHHVRSMFQQCILAQNNMQHIREFMKQHGLPVPGARIARDAGIPQFANLTSWLRNFANASDPGAAWDWGCYHPFNLQTRYLSCEDGQNWGPHHITPGFQRLRNRSLQIALRNLEATPVVGLTEYYQESLCLLIIHQLRKAPSFCNCTDARSWGQFRGTWFTQSGLAPTKREEFSAEELGLVERLTRDDETLYRAAYARLRKESAEIEARFGVRVLCENAHTHG